MVKRNKMFTVKEIKFILLIIFSVIAAYTDYKYGKIFNWTNFSLIGIGLLIAAYEHFLLNAVAGIVVALILMFPFFMTGGMGAGDVKFAMATGTIVGGKNLLLILALSAGLILLYALFARLGLFKIIRNSVVMLWKGLKAFVKYLFTTFKISLLGGRPSFGYAIQGVSGSLGKSERKKKVKYGIFLGLANIIFSVYYIMQQGGIL